MDAVYLEEKYILEYIKDVLSDIKTSSKIVDNAKYHHTTSYTDAPSVCKYGILTMLDLKNYGIRDYTDEFLNKMDDIDSHINGNNHVSLSIVGLKNISPKEEEYDPYDAHYVDFLVSDSIKARRMSTHYGNEFIAYGSINIDKLRSIDIRLLNLIKEIEETKRYDYDIILNLIEKYNCLKEIALAMKISELDIPLREMSDSDNIALDIDKLSKEPKILLKELA